MIQQELDAMPIGHYHSDGSGNQLMKIGDDQFMIYDPWGNRTTGNGAWVCSMTGGILGSLGAVSTSSSGGSLTITGVSWPPGPTITPEEKIELDNLESEAKVYVKQNRLNKFKALPRHLRQEIVDEGLIRDLIMALDNEDESGFPDIDKLKQLRNKNNHWHTSSGLISVSSIGGFIGHNVSYGKYENVLKHFKTEELAKAHAEVCLEEEIKD